MDEDDPPARRAAWGMSIFLHIILILPSRVSTLPEKDFKAFMIILDTNPNEITLVFDLYPPESGKSHKKIP
jgi:hypothetical protein